MKTQIERAKDYNKTLSGSQEYKEAMIYCKYGAYIGIKKCTKISKS